MERDALYYPNIYIHDVDWLKRTLLIFPHVARIVPGSFVPNDVREIWEFERVLGRGDQPLLRRANLQTSSVWTAQERLAAMLQRDIAGMPSQGW
jgi:hypothetical protein